MKNILAKIVLWGILLWGGFALIRHLFHRICHQYKPTKILGHKKLWSDKCEMMGRKISYYVQKNMVLWAERYDIMGRKRAERSLGGCSSPLSLTCQQYFPSSHPSPTEAPSWSTWVTLFPFLKNGNPFFVDWFTLQNIFLINIIGSYQSPTEAPGWSTWVTFCSLLKIGNSSLLIDSHRNKFSLSTSLVPLKSPTEAPDWSSDPLFLLLNISANRSWLT